MCVVSAASEKVSVQRSVTTFNDFFFEIDMGNTVTVPERYRGMIGNCLKSPLQAKNMNILSKSYDRFG